MAKTKKSKIDNVWTYNFAELPEVRDAIKQIIIPKLKAVRDNRRPMEDDWMRFYNMWNVHHDAAHTYSGRAKLYIPEVRKNVEAQARQLTEAMFPSEDFFTCSPGSAGTRRGAQTQKSIRMWQIEQAQLRTKMHVFNRQEVLFGTSPAYICWRKDVEHAFRRARDPKSGKIGVTRELIEIYNGPEFMVRDLFKWYALNPHKPDILEDGCAEYFSSNLFDLETKDKAGQLYGKDEILKGNSDAYKLQQMERDIERAETLGLWIDPSQGYSGAASLNPEDSDKLGTYLTATIYAKIAVPQACLPEEDPSLGIPFKIEIYNDEHVGFAGRNPFFHQRPPYVIGKYILPNADEFYGQGIPKATQYMQYEMNSKAEQAMDSATLALNPIAFIDPAMAAQTNNFEIEPGAIWYVNPQAAKLAAMPDVTATGYNAIGMLSAKMQSYSDLSPALPPQLQGKSRTATQADIIDRAASTDSKTFQLQNEILVLQPLMEMWESLTDQNIEEDQVIMILGRKAADWKQTLVTKNHTIGRYKYFWKVASYQQNKQILSRQIIDMMKVAGSLPPQEQQKLNFQYAEAVRWLWTEGFQLPDADNIVGQDDNMSAMDPEVALKMLELGMEVDILPGDDDQKFIQVFNAQLEKTKDGWMKDQIVKQIFMHQVQLQKKQAQQRLMMDQLKAQLQQQAAQQNQIIVNNGQGGQGGQSGSGTQGSGNRTQLSPNTSVGAMGKGVRA